MRVLAVAARFTLLTLLLCGIAYPLAVTGLAQLLFASRANGSLVTDVHGRVVGSELIGQRFTRPSYFWPRPSAAGDQGWDATSSAGSNLSVTSKKLHERVGAERVRLQQQNPGAEAAVPDDLLTASASGLDPHISPAAARWQAPRVAQARGVSLARVQALVDASVEGRELGFLGEPRVDVLALNLALDQQFGVAGP
ncbi:MAG TPA: potassium-transporting ATPase subunit KdpC [Polyangia bacterium]|nr:potassium-transporting ATPase subunit KdpC [Polyangia bacterium]